MIKQHRPNAPKWLTHNYKRWGTNFKNLKQKAAIAKKKLLILTGQHTKKRELMFD